MTETPGICTRDYPLPHRKPSRLAGDYAYARSRAKLSRGDRRFERGYDVAIHFASVIADRRRDVASLEQSFRENVDRWKDETGHLSSITKATVHPSYLRIIGMARMSTGHELERLILKELESEPDHWFSALSAITGEDPVKPEHDFDEAVNAWLSWGRERGIV